MPTSGDPPLRQLAALLTARKDEVLQRWKRAVLADPLLPTVDRLSLPQLLDHVPSLLDRMIGELGRAAAGEQAENLVRNVGRSEPTSRHAELRFELGFSIPEASRELLHLRRTLIDVCGEATYPLTGEAARLVHGALDETLIFLNTKMASMEQAERERADHARQETEAQFRETFEMAAVGIAHVGLDGRWLRVNRKLCDIVGYSRDDLLRLTYGDITHADDREVGQALVRRLIAGAIPSYSIEKRYVRQDGATVWVNLSVSLIHGATGEAQYMVAVIEDISHRKRTEAALRRNEEKLRAILATLPVGVGIVDRFGTLVDVNDAMANIWGGTRLVGLHRFDEYQGRWPETGQPLKAEDWAASRAVRKGETSLREVIDIVNFQGEKKTILNSARPLRNDQQEIVGAVVVNQDISDLRRIEAEARQASRDREELISIVSHDLKNPLSAILLNTELLARTLPADAEGQKARLRVEHILRSAESMNRLIVDLLDLSRIRAGKLVVEPESQGVAALIGESCDALTPAAQAKAQYLECAAATGLPAVDADRARVLQVLSNLVGNAIKFTPPGGRITVTAAADGAHVRVCVQDTGPGIPDDQLPHLFQRFWQAKATSHQGTGLGLAIARGIVEAHGGRIWAESTAGMGATFIFTLPAAGPQTGQIAA